MRVGNLCLCAIIGTLTFAILVVWFQGYRWIARSPESGGLIYNLVWLVLLVGETLFKTAWGIPGAVAGAGIGWLLHSFRRGPKQ